MKTGYQSCNTTSSGLGLQIIQLGRLYDTVSSLKDDLPEKSGTNSDEFGKESVTGKADT